MERFEDTKPILDNLSETVSHLYGPDHPHAKKIKELMKCVIKEKTAIGQSG
jgi:hypothetical protein